MPPKGSSSKRLTPTQGQALMNRFFTPAPQPRKPGRPFLPFKKRGPKPVEAAARAVTAELSYVQVVAGVDAMPANVPDVAAATPAPATVVPVKRTNWSKGEQLIQLTTAVNDSIQFNSIQKPSKRTMHGAQRQPPADEPHNKAEHWRSYQP